MPSGSSGTTEYLECSGKKGVIGALEQCLDESEDMKVEIEALELLMDPEDSEVCLRYILTHARRRGSRIFEFFSTKEENQPLGGSQKPLVGVPRTGSRSKKGG